MEKKMPVKWKECPFDESEAKELQGLRGVYVIWDKNMEDFYVVGRGNLEERLKYHLNNDEELDFSLPIELHFRYAVVSEEYQHRIENYLIQELKPLKGWTEPDPFPIQYYS